MEFVDWLDGREAFRVIRHEEIRVSSKSFLAETKISAVTHFLIDLVTFRCVRNGHVFRGPVPATGTVSGVISLHRATDTDGTEALR